MGGLQQRYIVVGGVRLSYLERLAEQGSEATPILLLHGLLATAETLAELIVGLPAERRIVALDLLSAERADGEKLDVHFQVLAELIHGFVDSVGLVRPVVIGHSHGGVLTLRLTVSQRTLFKALVLMCPAHPFAGYRDHVVAFYLTRLGRFLALCIPLAPKWAILRAYNEAAGPKSRIRLQHLRPYLRVLRNRDTLRRVLEMLATWEDDMSELRADLMESPIQVPTLLLWGDADPVVYISSAPELEKHLLDSERVTLPGMGHLLAEEAPDVCSRAIADWLIRREL